MPREEQNYRQDKAADNQKPGAQSHPPCVALATPCRQPCDECTIVWPNTHALIWVYILGEIRGEPPGNLDWRFFGCSALSCGKRPEDVQGPSGEQGVERWTARTGARLGDARYGVSARPGPAGAR